MPGIIKIIFSDTHRNYYYIIGFLAASLPVSVFTTSLAQILLVLNWLIQGHFSEKLKTLKERKAPLIITLLFAIHIAGLLYTSDFQYAFHDLKIKLPILVLPIIIGSSASFSKKQIRNLLLLFVSSVLVSSLVSTSFFFGLFDQNYIDFREISPFISHIRLSLMANLAIFCLLFYGFGGDKQIIRNTSLRILLLMAAIWLFGFLFILKSITGLLIFLILFLFVGWRHSAGINDIAPRFIARVLLLTIPLLIASWLSHTVAKIYYRGKINFSELESHTPTGNPYFHDTDSKLVENGNYVWVNVCEGELREEWNKISDMDYDGKDSAGQNLRFTLIRYLTSKGFPKDAGGMGQLNLEDIKAVENGIANYIFLNKFSLYPRVYQIIWELDNYKRGSNPSGHSVALRLEYLKGGVYIIKKNLFFGVGTGDVQHEFNSYYKLSENPLDEKSQRRAHNQLLTFIITFGIVGFFLSIYALFMPVFIEKRWGDYLFLCFGIIGFMSFINEDTLETTTGVTFFMFFYSLFLFGRNKIKNPESNA